MKLVWAAEWGEYETRDIVAVFTTRQQAETFCRRCNARYNPHSKMSISYRPLQLCETDDEIADMWPLTGEIPQDAA